MDVLSAFLIGTILLLIILIALFLAFLLQSPADGKEQRSPKKEELAAIKRQITADEEIENIEDDLQMIEELPKKPRKKRK